MMTSCSVKKNTAGTRFFHSFTAKYNTLYNGQVAYKAGMDAQRDGHKDNFNELLPMYISTTKATASIGKSNYETAILKSEKAIKLHSIKRRPTVKQGKKRNQKTKDYLQRKEYNPYLWHAWMLLGQSQFCEGNFIEAASTFNYTARLYQKQPEIAGLARTWLAKCYVALQWPYDAEDVLNKLRRDSISRRAMPSYTDSRTSWMIETQQYKEAVPLLQKVIKNENGRIQRARLNYLLAQLAHETDDNQLANRSLKKVLRANPPYEMTINARIFQAQMAPKGQHQRIVKKLKRMAKSDNNLDYKDQIYLAIGNIHLGDGDTLHCIYAWEKGLKESTKGGSAKAQLALSLATLYWQQENYIDAARCYKECMTLLDKERKDYKEIQNRSEILNQLEPHLSAIKLQDSLQALAKLSPAEQKAIAERLVKEYKKKEKEEAKLQENKDLSANKAQADEAAKKDFNQKSTNPNAASAKEQSWYFSSMTAVQKGKEAFRKKWGNRVLADNWRRATKSNFQTDADENGIDYNLEDSLANDSNYSEEDEIDEEEKARLDSLANDPHNPQFYLNQIPNTEEQIEKSNQLLSDGLYNAGILEKDRLGNYPLAGRTLERLLHSFPDYKTNDQTLYYLFLISAHEGKKEEAQAYRDTLMARYPDSKLAKLLGNPKYEMIAAGGKHLEDSIYTDTYKAYRSARYNDVHLGYEFSTENYPEGHHRARFLFIEALSQLRLGNKQVFLDLLKELTEKYSSEELSKLAAEIMKGVQEGRLLRTGSWDTSALWSRTTRQPGDSTSVGADTLTDERITKFNFILAYPKGALDEDQLLFEIARYNFTSYVVRNFELELSDLEGISMLSVRGFESYDEAHAYAQSLFSDRHMVTVLDGLRAILISDDNLKLLGTQYSFDEYKEYFDKNYAPLEVPKDLIIDENQPDLEGEVNEEDNENEDDNEGGNANKPANRQSTTDNEDDFPFGF